MGLTPARCSRVTGPAASAGAVPVPARPQPVCVSVHGEHHSDQGKWRKTGVSHRVRTPGQGESDASHAGLPSEGFVINLVEPKALSDFFW